MLAKPPTCEGCDLLTKGRGYVPPVGPDNAPFVFVGESAGDDEARTGTPFVGAAGSMLSRILTMLGRDRASIRIDNVCRCQPPKNWLDGAPWEWQATNHCSRVHLAHTLAEPHQVIIPLGNIALRNVLGLRKARNVSVQNFHGTINYDQYGRLVVPSYHPSFLQRGAHNLIGTVIWDLKQAEKALRQGKPEDPASLIVDPDLEWFRAWVDTVIAARQQDRYAYPISSDIETPDKAHGKDEGEITAEDRSFIITRINVSCHPDEGVTVPAVGPYMDEIKRLHQSPGPIWGWNYTGYDFERTVAAEILREEDFRRVVDLMWLAHVLQSDLPRGLGFWAPFYSSYGAWKHLADSEPALYGAIDGLQNHRVGFGIIGDLERLGMLQTAMRHVCQLHAAVLRPAQLAGVKIDRERLLLFKAELSEKATSRLDKLQDLFPAELRNLTPKHGLTKRPQENVLHVKATAFTRKGKQRKGKPASEIKLDLYKRAEVIEREIEKEILCCQTCGATEIQRRHRCPPADTDGVAGRVPARQPELVLESRRVRRYFWSEPFNPDSWQQVLAYIKWKGHQPGRAKKTYKDTTDRETLERLVKTGDPFYGYLLDYRAIAKVKGTYVDGTERRLDTEDRVHPEFGFHPSTMRLSARNPNIQNIIADKDAKDSLAAGFRKCIVAAPTTRLLEVDFSAIEAKIFGWLCRDPSTIRLAGLGIHAGLASHVLKRPYDPKWSDADLGAYFKEIKKKEFPTYDTAKRFVYANLFGMEPRGMVLQFPKFFPTQKIADKFDDLFRHMVPQAKPWRRHTRELAHKQHYLGGPGAHPFGYKHWFWSVWTYKRISSSQYWAILARYKQQGHDESEAPVTIINGQHFKVQLGDDGKRCIAYLPQSIAAGVLKESLLHLFTPGLPSYIGDAYFGRTPLRGPIHDSMLLELPTRTFDWAASLVCTEMLRPVPELPCPPEWGIGPYLEIGVAAKTSRPGGSWQDCEDIGIEIGTGGDALVHAAEEADQDDQDDMAREIVA